MWDLSCCQPDKINTTQKNNIKELDLNKYNILIGQVLSADH